jgi:phage tail sheath protein FI
MANLLSPGISISEIDLTTRVPQVSSTSAGFVCQMTWGPLNEVVLIDTEIKLVSVFGKPDDATITGFLTAASFLAYGDSLRLVRVADETLALNATTEATTGSGLPGTGLLIKNDSDYEANYDDGTANVGPFVAKYPGALGNSLKVSICPSAIAFSSSLLAVSSTGTTLTGTSFDTRLEPGSIIVAPNGQERRVVSVTNATTAIISSAFVPDLVPSTVRARWEYFSAIGISPKTTVKASAVGGVNDEMHIVVVDQDGLFTGVPGQILERFSHVSKAFDLRSDDGTSSYYVSKINNNSKYIRWTDHLPAGLNWGASAVGRTFTAVNKPSTFSFSGGANGAAISDAEKILGYDLFADSDIQDISLLIAGEASATVATHLIGIAESRADLVVCLSPLRADVVENVGQELNDIITYRDSLSSSSYACMDSAWKYMFDKYNDTYRWVPLNGDIAGLMVRTDKQREAWFSPAGHTRGIIKNAIKLSYSPKKAERDDLYVNGINPVISLPGEGILLYGNKTMLSQPSAFDRINVRRLFNVLKKAIKTSAKFSLFEFNDVITRSQFVNLINPYLETVKSGRGLYDFKVVCDSTNNTAEVIDRNEFIADIYLKPTRTAEFIRLNFVAVGSGIDFAEVVGQF